MSECVLCLEEEAITTIDVTFVGGVERKIAVCGVCLHELEQQDEDEGEPLDADDR